MVHAGIYLVEFLPFLRHVPSKPDLPISITYQHSTVLPVWFPGATFKKKAAEGSARAQEVLEIPFDNVRKEMVGGLCQSWCRTSRIEGGDQDQGIAQQSFVADQLHRTKLGDRKKAQEEEEIVKNCAGIMYLGEQ